MLLLIEFVNYELGLSLHKILAALGGQLFLNIRIDSSSLGLTRMDYWRPDRLLMTRLSLLKDDLLVLSHHRDLVLVFDERAGGKRALYQLRCRPLLLLCEFAFPLGRYGGLLLDHVGTG